LPRWQGLGIVPPLALSPLPPNRPAVPPLILVKDARGLLRLQLRAFALTWLSYATYYFTRKNVAVVKSRLHDELGITAGQLGTFDTAYLIAYAIGQFASGVLGDRIGPRRLLALGMLGSAAMALWFGVSSSFWPMLLAFAVNGFFQSTGWPGNVKAMQPFFSASQRGRVMGIWTTNYQAGGLAATALATFLLARFGWRAAFWVPALLVALVGLTLAALLVEKPQDRGLCPVETAPAEQPGSQPRAQAQALTAQTPLWSLASDPLLLLLGGSYFVLKLIRYSLLFWLPYYLRRHFHYTESQAGYLSLPFEIGGMFGAVTIGWLSDRYFRTRRLRLAAPALLGLGGAIFAYQVLGGVSLLANALLLSAVGFLLFGPDALLSGAVSQEIGGEHATARVAGVINGMGSVGAIFSPLLVAAVSERLGWSALFYGFAGLTIVASLLLRAALALQVRLAAEASP